MCYLMGTGESAGTPTRRAESLLGRARGSKGRPGLDLGKTLRTNKDNSALLQIAGEGEDPIQESR